jgi:hypothetical protein
MRYIVLDGFCPWVRGGCIARSRGEDVYPSSHAQRTIEILQLRSFLASLVFWLFLAFMVFGITLSLILTVVLPCMLTITQLLLQQNAHFYY